MDMQTALVELMLVGLFADACLRNCASAAFDTSLRPRICSGPRDAWRVSDDSAAKKKNPWFGRLQLPGRFCCFSVCR